MRYNISIGVLLFVAVTALWVSVSRVRAHSLGYDSVDGCEIRWEESTQYDTERVAAQNAWEALKGSDNCVDIEPDAWNTVTDLEWFDINDSTEDPGYYEQHDFADHIHLNSYYMNGYSSCNRKNVTMHELGHAHGLADHFITGNVMYDGVAGNCSLGTHDISDYEALWGASS